MEKKISKNIRVERLIDDFTLFDDTLMSMVFVDNIPATELLLKIILQRDDIEVISVTGQKKWQGPVVNGRTIRLDILARDQSGKMFNVEVQRENSGAIEQRARYHSSMIDSRMLKEGQAFKELLESYIIFITEKDYFKAGLPIYTINRHIEELDRVFCDGSHIIYVNGSYTGDDAIGTMLKDFRCKEAKDIYYPEFANGVRYFKEEGGRTDMCKAVEDYAKEYAQEYAEVYARDHVREYAQEYAKEEGIKMVIETALDFGASKESIIQKLYKKYELSADEAEKYYEEYVASL